MPQGHVAEKLIPLMYQSWSDVDSAVDGLSVDEAISRDGSASSIAWTVAHVTNQVDSWLNVRFQGLPPHPLISDAAFRTGGSGQAKDWPLILAGVNEVREAARGLLEGQELDLDRVIPYDGSIVYLRPAGLSLRYAVMRIAAHHFLHVGEIVTIRSRLGHGIEDRSDWGKTLI